MSVGDSLTRAALHIARAAQQLVLPLGTTDPSAAAVRALVESLGWSLPPGPPPPSLLALKTTAARMSADLDQLEAALAGGGDETSILAGLAAVFTDVGELSEELSALGGKLATELPPAFIDATHFDQQFVPRLLDALVIQQLYTAVPVGSRVLRLIGLVEISPQPADPATFQPEFTRYRVHWERIGQLFQHPEQILHDVYGWGTPQLTLAPLFDALQSIASALKGPGTFDYPSTSMLHALAPGADLTSQRIEKIYELPLVDLTAGKIMLAVTALPTLSPSELQGLAIALLATGSISGLEIPVSDHVSLLLDGSLDATAGLALSLRPDQPPAVIANYDVAGAPVSQGDLALTLNYVRRPEEDPLTLLDVAGCGLEARALSLGSGIKAGAAGFDPSVEVGLRGGRLGISASAVDGFLASLLPPDGAGIDFDLLLRWSRSRGVELDGAGGLEITIPLQRSLGPLRIESVTARAAVESGGLAVEVSTSVSATIGPLVVVVDRLGVALDVSFSSGNLGPLDLALGFKPPNGLGLSLSTPAVTGGGFLSFDFENEQYSGVLQLSIQNLIDVKAIGILTTRLPDGQPGYSLLLILTGEFPPIQLGLGFTLNGIGGLLGVHRTAAVDALRARLRNGALDAILFPPDPLHDAPALISTLGAVFPVARDRFVFGPMVKIGWGTPTLITLDLAVILELPEPVRLIVLGRLKAVLPDEKAPLVQIHLDAIGVLDFSRSEFSLDATLYDSRVVAFTLSGDMALRMSWGAQPSFLMALGGFHPAFKPPAGFPALERLAVALSTGDNPRLRMEAYFALTSNTVQAGAKLELYVGVAGFSLEGGLGFDTLIQFSPFRILADIEAYLALKRGSTTLMGLDISVHLMGPAPWVLWGQARFKILFIKFSIPFRATFGRAEDVPAIERQEVWPVLRDHLSAAASWSAQLPPDSGRLVVVRTDASVTDADPLTHPLGSLTVSQNLVPLERTLGLFGSVPPKDFDRFAIVGASGLDITGPQTQLFAPAQFRQMSDAEKLA
ncbi:MAG TPA: DUF6603 domain-containing protein, partial [Kofleriaceae bacterium]|nr:DUF6603 domain-containing protein [Kofleriaceae bacterium]